MTYFVKSNTGGTVENQSLTAQQFADNEKVKHGASIANLFAKGGS